MLEMMKIWVVIIGVGIGIGVVLIKELFCYDLDVFVVGRRF